MVRNHRGTDRWHRLLIKGLALIQMLTASIKTMPMPVTNTAKAVPSYSSQIQY